MIRINWQLGVVEAIIQETLRVKTFRLRLPAWTAHLPGQHYDLRLTAEDGYQAERSYSIASPPGQTGTIDLTIELVDGGEVSGYLHEGVAAGDLLEVRGPIGGYFVWRDTMAQKPLLLIGGGSGIVPLMAILRHRLVLAIKNPTRLLYSVRSVEETIYSQELASQNKQDPTLSVTITYTRQIPVGWQGYQRRIDRVMLAHEISQFSDHPICFVCGPTQLVESVADTLVELGIPANTIYTERFGPNDQSRLQ